MLTFEFNERDEALLIHGDPSGLELLANIIQRLIENTQEDSFDHTHLMTEDWGGNELTSTAQDIQADLIHHVKVYCWKGSKPQS